MAPTDVIVPQPPTSPRPLETPPGSPLCTPPNNTRVQGSPLVGTMDRFEQGVMKLIQALEKVDATTKPEDIESKTTNHVEAEQQKTRASKLEYKLVDEVWDTITSKYKIVDSSALPEAVTDLDALVSVFLRTLEYYRGIMVLTTNRVKDIDDAIQSRISVALHYGSLGLATRKTIWESFLKKVAAAKGRAEYTTADLDWLSKKEVNGRQIKNMITTAHALAVEEQVPLTRSHLQVVIGLDKEFQKDYNGAGQIANNMSYT